MVHHRAGVGLEGRRIGSGDRAADHNADRRVDAGFELFEQERKTQVGMEVRGESGRAASCGRRNRSAPRWRWIWLIILAVKLRQEGSIGLREGFGEVETVPPGKMPMAPPRARGIRAVSRVGQVGLHRRFALVEVDRQQDAVQAPRRGGTPHWRACGNSPRPASSIWPIIRPSRMP